MVECSRPPLGTVPKLAPSPDAIPSSLRWKFGGVLKS
jgi:hypothetical protein